MKRTTLEATTGQSVTVELSRSGHDYVLTVDGEPLGVYEDYADAMLAMQQAVMTISAAIRALGLLDPVDRGKQPDRITTWVQSETDPNRRYKVTRTFDTWECECPHYTYRGVPCKHIAHVKALGL